MQDYNQSLRKERRRKTRLFIVIILILLVLGSGSILYTVYFTDVFRFNKIVLNGAVILSKDELFPETKLPFLFADIKIANLLVAKTTVHKNILEKILTVDIEERKPYGVWCNDYNTLPVNKINIASITLADVTSTLSQNGSFTNAIDDFAGTQSADCLWFDHDGLLFARSPATAGVLVKSIYESEGRNLTVGNKVLPEGELKTMFSIFEVLDAEGVGVVKYILPDLKFQEIHALITGGTTLYFSLRIDPSFVPEALQSLKPKLSGLKYADFRSENKVFYK